MKTSWRYLCRASWRRLENFLKTSWRRLKDIWPRQIYWSWPRRLEDVFWRRRRKTSSRRLHQDKCLLGYYLEADSHIRKKVKVVLGLPNYANKKELEHTTVVDTSDLDDKKDLIAFKAEVNKLDISKLVNVPNSLNNFYKN